MTLFDHMKLHAEITRIPPHLFRPDWTVKLEIAGRVYTILGDGDWKIGERNG